MTPTPCFVNAAEPADPTVFRDLFRRHPAGVAVVALDDDERPIGFTATSVISVSAEPPVLVFSMSGTSSSWPALSRATSLTVNFLAADHVGILARFATSGVDRFAGIEWRRLPTGEPVLAGVPAWVRGEVLQRTPIGTSFLVAVRAVQAVQCDGRRPLIYHDRSYHHVDGSTAV